MRLDQYIEKHGITKTEMAKRLNITPTHCFSILKMVQAPSRQLAERIFEVTNGEVSKAEAIFPEDYV